MDRRAPVSLCVCLSVGVYLKPVPPELLLQGGNREGTTSSAIKQSRSGVGFFCSLVRLPCNIMECLCVLSRRRHLPWLGRTSKVVCSQRPNAKTHFELGVIVTFRVLNSVGAALCDITQGTFPEWVVEAHTKNKNCRNVTH